MLHNSHLSFWFKRILIMLAVMLAAIMFLIFTPEQSTSDTLDDSKQKNNVGLSEGITRFYSEFRQTSRDPIKDMYGEQTILLDDINNVPLSSTIANINSENSSKLKDWKGSVKQRAFAKDSTLKQEASRHASDEGLTLVWDLNQDFIINHRFTSNKNIVGMLEEIAGAVDSNFNHPINIHYCFKKRALVLTERESEYLNKHCFKTSGTTQTY